MSSASSSTAPPAPLTIDEKLEKGKGLKDEADAHFKAGELDLAIRRYHESLLYLNGLNTNVQGAMASNPPAGAPKERTELDIIIEKVYSNMCAAHLKKGNWERVISTADQVLKKNPDNSKAKFRKAKAFTAQGYTEKAIELLEKLNSNNPEDAEIRVELDKARKQDKAASKKGMKAFKGMFERPGAEKVLAQESAHVEEVSTKLEESRIEEVTDP